MQTFQSHLSLCYSNRHRLPISEGIENPKAILKHIDEKLEVADLFTMKFYMLNRIFKILLRFGDLGLLDASSSEHFNYTIKTFIRMPIMTKGIFMEDSAKNNK